MRYYLTTPSGEQGPYEEQHIREWLRSGTMPKDAPVRAENETTTTPASQLFPGEASAPAAPPFAPSGPTPLGAANMYAPPIETGGNHDWVVDNQGSFGKGFVIGFFCGCIALIASYVMKDMGSETKRGIRVGFATGFAIGMVIRIIAAASR